MLELGLGLGLGVTLHYYFLAHLAEERGEPVVALGAPPSSGAAADLRELRDLADMLSSDEEVEDAPPNPSPSPNPSSNPNSNPTLTLSLALTTRRC